MKQSTRKLVLGAAIVAFGLSSLVITNAYAKGEDSVIVGVMGKVFKGDKKTKKPSTVQKAYEGKASAEELKTLLEQLKILQKEKPPKGEQKAWDDRNTALVSATELLIKGDKDGGEKLKAAANCKECHKAHQKD